MSQHWPYRQDSPPRSPGLRPEARYVPYNARSAGASPLASPTGEGFASSASSAGCVPMNAAPGVGVGVGRGGAGTGAGAGEAGEYSRSWTGEGTGARYLAELESPMTSPRGEVVFEMDGSSAAVPTNKQKQDEDKNKEKAAGSPAAEGTGLVQANPWPFYLDLPVGPKGDGPKGLAEEGRERENKREESDGPAAAPWPYHGPPGRDDEVSATVHPPTTTSRGDRSQAEAKQEAASMAGNDDAAGISALDDYLSSLGIEDDAAEVPLERADSTLKPRPLSLSGRGRAASEGASPGEGEAAPSGRTYLAYRPWDPSSAHAQQVGEGPRPGTQGSQEPEYPPGTAPHHFYLPQGLVPPRKPVASASPTSPTFASPGLPSPQQPQHHEQQQHHPSRGRTSSDYAAYRPPFTATSDPTSPVPSSAPGFVAYHPNAGPISPKQAQNASFTAFRPHTCSSSQASSPVATAFSPPGRVTSPHHPHVRPSPSPAQGTATQPPGPPYPEEESDHAASPGLQPSQYFGRYASPPAALPNRLASPPVGGVRPTISRHDSPAQPSPVSSPGSVSLRSSHQRTSPHLSSSQHPPPPPPPPPQEPLASVSPHGPPAAHDVQHPTPGSEAPHFDVSTQPLSPHIPDEPPPPYMPVDLPPRPGSAGVLPSYRSDSSPEPLRAGSYGPLRPSVTGDAPRRQDQFHSHQGLQDGQGHPPPLHQPPAGYMRGREEAAPPPLPPRRTSSPPLPTAPPPPPPRPTNFAGGGGRGSAAAPVGFGGGLPNATSFPPPPKTGVGSGAAVRPPRMPVGRPPPAPSSQRPPPTTLGSSPSPRPTTSHTAEWRPTPHASSSAPQGHGGRGSHHNHGGGTGRGGGGIETMFWSSSTKRWLQKTERLVEQTLGDIMQPQVDQGVRPGQMPGGYPGRGRGR